MGPGRIPSMAEPMANMSGNALKVSRLCRQSLEAGFRARWRGPWTPAFKQALCVLGVLAGLGLASGEAGSSVDFNRDIRRVLSDNCFKCHGPDAKERKGGKHGLRLDTREGAMMDLGGYAAIVPGHPENSELVRRITTNDPDDKMPPTESATKLSARDIGL